jgi:hypothetical protein
MAMRSPVLRGIPAHVSSRVSLTLVPTVVTPSTGTTSRGADAALVPIALLAVTATAIGAPVGMPSMTQVVPVVEQELSPAAAV